MLDEKAIKAKEKGEKDIPTFRAYLPQGKNHEIIKGGIWCELIKCDVDADGIRYIAMNARMGIYYFFSEIDCPFDPDMGYVYIQKKQLEYFCPITIPSVIEYMIKGLNTDFHRAWLYNLKFKFDPKNAIFDPIAIINTLDKILPIYRDFFEKSLKIYNSKPPNFLETMTPLLKADKTKRRLPENYISQFKQYFDQALFLKNSLGGGLGVAINKLPRKSQAHSVKIELKGPTFYIIPNGDTTLVLLITLHPLRALNHFSYFPDVYQILKILYNRFQTKLKDF